MKQPKKADTDFEPAAQVAEEDEQPKKLVQGYEWSQVPGIDERLEAALWNAGVLQLEDLNNTPLIVSALQAYYSVDAGQLRTRVKEYTDEQR